MKPLVRWTIGPVQPAGYECLVRSVISFQKLYNADLVICQNGHPPLPSHEKIGVINQDLHELVRQVRPIGVAWKLCPPRLDLNRHEIFIDNDLVLEERISEIDFFLSSDCTLMLEGESRMYGRFEKHVPKGYTINSGLFGVPPGFNLEKFIRFYGPTWEQNCYHTSHTWDEQGLVATALLSYHKSVIIPKTTVTNCETKFVRSKGMHFVGLNRRSRHRPWLEYKTCNSKLIM